MKRNDQLAFTMIEMVVVIAVIAILALMAVPNMMDRVVRSQVVDGMQLANLAKAAVNNYYALKGEMPATNEIAGAPPKDKIIGNYVASVEIVNGAVTITFGNNVNAAIKGKRLTLRPAIVADTPAVPPSWLCNTAPVPAGMTAVGNNQTDISANLLPISCR